MIGLRTFQSVAKVALITLPVAGQAAPPEMAGTVRLNGLDTYYEAYGDGNPILFLHGGTQSSALWHEYVEDFADSYTVLLVDLLGHGRSTPLDNGFSHQRATKQLADLLQYLEIEQFSGVGFSLGGEVLLNFAIEYPDRLEQMIVVGATHNFPGADFNRKFSALTHEEMEQFRAIHVHGDAQIRALYEAVWDPEFKFQLDIADVRSISSETLIVMGERDRTATGDAQRSLRTALELHELLPHSHLWIVPDEGHRTFDGKGKPEFVRVAREFFAGKWR